MRFLLLILLSFPIVSFCKEIKDNSIDSLRYKRDSIVKVVDSLKSVVSARTGLRSAFIDSLFSKINNDSSGDLYAEFRKIKTKKIKRIHSVIPLVELYELERQFILVNEPIRRSEYLIRLSKQSNHYHYYYFDSIRQRYTEEFLIYDFKAGDTIADIGGGNGFFTLDIYFNFDNLLIYYTEIDTLKFNFFKREIEAYSRNHSVRMDIIPVLGTDSSTCLEEIIFDKIILRNVFHEFKYPCAMLQSIKKSMDEHTILYIKERPVEKQAHCSKAMSRGTIVNLLMEEGFDLVNEKLMADDWILFQFKVKMQE